MSCHEGSPGRNESSDGSFGGLKSSPSSWENVDEKEIGDKVFSFFAHRFKSCNIFPVMGKGDSSNRKSSHFQPKVTDMFPGSSWSTDPVGARPSCSLMYEM